MCGIVGIVNSGVQRSVSEEILTKMRDTMIHRGPDACGIWISADKQIGFAHRRLSIIDISEVAKQPMSNEDQSLWIVFNGEIYNHVELRRELVRNGHRFKTDHSDTEVIIHAYEEWGKNCALRFRGMFACAVWNNKTKSLWLCRDYMGIKPLYYAFHKGGFIFASEIKAILAYPGIDKAVDEEAMYHYFSFLTSPSPQTLFKGIQKMSSGSHATLDALGYLKVERYWDVWNHAYSLSGISEREIMQRLLAELKIAVDYQKISDVPVGVFLSGGLDSCINAALFAKDHEEQVKTFAIGYDREYRLYKNEFRYAQIMAKKLNTAHYEKKLSLHDFLDFLPTLIYHQEEPIADPTCVPIYYLAALAKEHNVTVCQLGEGSDELFCGYPFWKTFVMLQQLSNLPFMNSFKRMGMFYLKKNGFECDMKYELLRRSVNREPVFWGGAEAFTETEKKQLFCDRLNKKFIFYSSYEAIKPLWERFQAKAWEKSPLNWMGYLDLNFRLPELLLTKVDKMTMIASLEARVPFLDHKFVELAMSIPQSVKLKNGTLKYILKKAVRGLIPDELINRKKQGFTVPVTEWFLDKLGDVGKKKIFAFCKRTDFFNRRYIEELFRVNDGYKLWYVLNFVLWYEYWCEGQGDSILLKIQT
ncbi:MAG: asparagine synthase (glutamine-hydrolyzing) [Ignavibacteriales bacterium]|nr:asparagine synthase (glutamine-hydrolyzing) [Ignavibacteriales bacterium]